MDKQTIIEGLRYCSAPTPCDGCPYEKIESQECIVRLIKDALELIEDGGE